MIATGPSIIVEIEKMYNDRYKSEFLDLQLDPMFNRTHNIMYKGIVKALPVIEPFNETHDKIDPILEEGDLIYFRYIAVDDERMLMDKSVSDMSEKLTIKMFYKDVFCVIRNGEIITIGGWCLGEPFIDGKGELIEVAGDSGAMVKVRAEYIEGTKMISNINRTLSKEKCIVRYISTFKGEETGLKIGDIVFAGVGLSFENTIEGKKFYCFHETTVQAILGNVND
jgi:hypothetical protein